MIQWLWYHILQIYVRWGLQYYFKKIIIKGEENIPKGPVLFAANHQNALLDALLIVCFNPHWTYFLTRADIFKKPFVHWLLSGINMLPIYRLRDGWQSLGENQKVFDACSEIFKQNNAITIFPEGNHGDQRRVRSLSKGFTRLAFEALQKYPELKINVVPVGLNYTAHQSFRSSVSIYFGRPLLANDYFKEPLQSEANRLRNDLSECFKNLTTHIESTERYTDIIQKLESTAPNYLDPTETNARIAKIEKGEFVASTDLPKPMRYWIFLPVYYLALLINFIPLALWRKIKKGIKDPVFVASLKFGTGISLFPLVYILFASLAYIVFGPLAAMGVLVFCIPSMILLHKSGKS